MIPVCRQHDLTYKIPENTVTINEFNKVAGHRINLKSVAFVYAKNDLIYKAILSQHIQT